MLKPKGKALVTNDTAHPIITDTSHLAPNSLLLSNAMNKSPKSKPQS